MQLWDAMRPKPASGWRAGALSGGNELVLLEEADDLARRLLGGLALGLADDLGVLGRLVGIRDAGELLDLAGASLRVEALDVAVLARLDRGLYVGLDEAAVHHLPRLVADLAIGRDRGRDHRDAVARQQVGDERDPADVGVAVLLRETETLREVLADDVAVENLELRPSGAQLLHEQVRDRGLPRAREPGEPQAKAIVLSHRW